MLHRRHTVPQGTKHVVNAVRVHAIIVDVRQVDREDDSVPVEETGIAGLPEFLSQFTDGVLFLQDCHKIG